MKSDLVLSVHLKRGAVWEATRGVRARWGIEAQTRVPPSTSPGAYYVPAGFPEKPPQGDDAAYEKWADLLSEWTGELLALYKAFVPESCREPAGADFLNWTKFLSALVVFDPPVPGLREFRTTLEEPRVVPRLMPAPNEPDHVMVAPPITWVGDGQNPPRPVIDPKPWHTDEDILNAARIIRSTFLERPKTGRKRSDSLLDAEIAILHDQHGWTYEGIADHHEWRDYTRVSKYVKRGRENIARL